MEVLGIIPARGGSKSIPNKNIVDLCGKPLLFYTCEAAKKSKTITRLIISTDDKKIAEVAKKYGAEVPFMRPAELAKDDTPALPVILHALEFLKKNENYTPDIVVLLQPTSPLRKAEHIDQAVNLLTNTEADSVVSIVEIPHNFNPVSVMWLGEDDKLTPYKEGPAILRRQDKPKVYGRNGPAVLVMRCETITEKKSLYGDDVRGFLMSPEESIDIDTPFDLEVAKCMIEKVYS